MKAKREAASFRERRSHLSDRYRRLDNDELGGTVLAMDGAQWRTVAQAQQPVSAHKEVPR